MSFFDSSPCQKPEDELAGSSASSVTDILVFQVNKIENITSPIEKHKIEVQGEIIWADLNIAKARSKYIRRQLEKMGNFEDETATSAPILQIRLPCKEAVSCIREYLKEGDISHLQSFTTDKTKELKALLLNGQFLEFTERYWRKFYMPLLRNKIQVAWNGMWWSYPTISEHFLLRVLPTIYGLQRVTASVLWYSHTISLDVNLETVISNFMSKFVRNLCQGQMSKVPDEKLNDFKTRHAKAMQLLLTEPKKANVKGAIVTNSEDNSTLENVKVKNQNQRDELYRLNLKLQRYQCPRCHKSIPRAAKNTETCIRLWHLKSTTKGKKDVIKWACCGQLFEEGKESGCRFEISKHTA